MSTLGSLMGKQIEETDHRDDGISIRTLNEQDEFVKSPSYQGVLADLEELKNRRETRRQRNLERMKKYNKERYRLENKIKERAIYRKLKSVKNNIPKITLDGKIIYPENER